jgi:hypothetical protein
MVSLPIVWGTFQTGEHGLGLVVAICTLSQLTLLRRGINQKSWSA